MINLKHTRLGRFGFSVLSEIMLCCIVAFVVIVNGRLFSPARELFALIPLFLCRSYGTLASPATAMLPSPGQGSVAPSPAGKAGAPSPSGIPLNTPGRSRDHALNRASSGRTQREAVRFRRE